MKVHTVRKLGLLGVQGGRGYLCGRGYISFLSLRAQAQLSVHQLQFTLVQQLKVLLLLCGCGRVGWCGRVGGCVLGRVLLAPLGGGVSFGLRGLVRDELGDGWALAGLAGAQQGGQSALHHAGDGRAHHLLAQGLQGGARAPPGPRPSSRPAVPVEVRVDEVQGRGQVLDQKAGGALGLLPWERVRRCPLALLGARLQGEGQQVLLDGELLHGWELGEVAGEGLLVLTVHAQHVQVCRVTGRETLPQVM